MAPSLWLEDLAPTPLREPPSRCDVAVIGGGIAGICLALHCARLGLDTALFEARDLATRASGRNDGQILLGLGEHYHRVVSQFGGEKARRLWRFLATNHEELLGAIEGLDCDLRRAGGLRLAETPHEREELAEASEKLLGDGIPHRLLDEKAVREMLPGARGFFGAIELPGEAVVQPARMARGLGSMAAAAGARLVPHREVRAIQGEAGDFSLELAGDTVRAGVVVHCTSALARGLDDTGFLARTVFPFRGQILASEPLPADIRARFPDRAMSSNFCYEYFRAHGNRFVIGGMRWSVPGEEAGILDDDTANPLIRENLLGYVARHFPSLHGVRFPAEWTGIMAGTPDGLPLLGGIPGKPGVFTLSAFNGYGLSFAFHGARCLASIIASGRSPDPDADLFAPRRFWGS
ncbi:MAG: FAD-dependent oxidoreductase [Planctomycetota bacterium]